LLQQQQQQQIWLPQSRLWLPQWSLLSSSTVFGLVYTWF